MLFGDPFNPHLATLRLSLATFPHVWPVQVLSHFPDPLFSASQRLCARLFTSQFPISIFPISNSGNDAEFFPQLHRLGAALGAQFVKDAAGMSLYGVFAHEELFGDFPVAETLGDEAQYFQFARRDGEGFAFAVVRAKGFAGWNGDFLYDHPLLFVGQLQAKPDAESGKRRCNQASVDFDGVLDDEEAVLRPFQRSNENAGDQTVQEDMTFHWLQPGSVWGEFYY